MEHVRKPLFKDEKLQKHFDEEGYVTIQLLDEKQVTLLRDLYFEKANIELTADFNETTKILDLETNIEISDTIKSMFEKGGEAYFTNHAILGGTFFIKRAHGESEFPVHQDWNMVEEERYYGALIWCPLQDVTKENGAIFAIPGSHKYFDSTTYRSGSIHPPRFPSSVFKEKNLAHALKTIELKAGEVLIYQNSLYHGSHPNTSDRHRFIATGSLISEASKLLYFHRPSGTANLIQAVDASNYFFLKHLDEIVSGNIPQEASIVKTMTKEPYYPTAEELTTKIQKAFAPKKKHFFWKWFGA